MIAKELTTLCRKAWNDSDSFRVLLDYLLTEEIIEVPKNDGSSNAENYENWILESGTRQFILNNCKIKADFIQRPIHLPTSKHRIFDWLNDPFSVSKEELDSEDEQCRTYLFLIKQRSYKDILIDPFGTGPVKRFLGDRSSRYEDEFKKFLEPIFKTIEPNKTEFSDFIADLMQIIL